MQKIGNILDIDVYYSNIEETVLYEKQDLSSKTIALYFHKKLDRKSLEIFFRKICEGLPLSIFICGKNSDYNFEVLLQHLSYPKTEKHIMTNVGNDEKWIYDFIYVSLPANERFDEWQNQLIFEIGGKTMKQTIIDFIKKES